MLTGGGPRRAYDPALRMGVAAFLVIVGFAFLFIRLGYLQLGPMRDRLADVNRRVWSNMYVHSQRGRILDRQGRILAASVEGRSLYAHPLKVKDKNRLALILSKLDLMPLEESLERLSSQSPFVWLVRGIDPDRWIRLKPEFAKVEGIGVLTEWRRRYPLGEVGANVLGFVGADGHGLSGIEYVSDRGLAGDVGSLKVEIAEHGMPVIRDAEGRENPVFRGEDVKLSIDAYLQESTDKILSSTVEQYDAKGGSVVVTECQTGRVLAMSSYPTFDPNRFSEFVPSLYRNMAVNAVFEPGSTFKIVTISSVCSDHRTALSEHYDCNGSIKPPGSPRPIRCYASHGPITFRAAVEASCNVGIIRAAQPVPQEVFYRAVQSFGFGIQTGVDLPGEEKGILKKPYRWSLSTQSSMSIGHEVAVTNLQLAMAMGVIANGGDLLKPMLILSGDGKPKTIRQVIRPETAMLVRDFLISVVEGELGTGKRAKIPGVRSGGKTGTAQVPDPKTGGYDQNRFVSSYIGFFPAESPRYVVSVVIQEPNPSIAHRGAEVAAPAFSKIGASVVKFIDPSAG